MHIIVGLFFIALGIWGVFDEWYYVVDFIKGASAVVMVVVGAIAMLTGLVGPSLQLQNKKEKGLGILTEVEEDV